LEEINDLYLFYQFKDKIYLVNLTSFKE